MLKHQTRSSSRRIQAYFLTFAAAALLLGGGCSSSEPVQPEPTGPVIQNTVQFGTIVSMKIGDTTSFPDGLLVTLQKIDDSRCPADVQCIWAGQLAPVLLIKEGASATSTQEVQLGTLTAPQAKTGPYVFNLKNATTANIVLTVEKP